MNTVALNVNNQIIHAGLTNAMSAVAHLNDNGCAVLRVQVRQQKPVIVIDRPYGPFLRGVPRMRFRDGDKTRVIMVATVYGCQVEWKETRTNAQEAQQA